MGIKYPHREIDVKKKLFRSPVSVEFTTILST